MNSNNSINSDPSRLLSPAASLSDAGTSANNNEAGETRVAAPLAFNDRRRVEVLNNEEKEGENLEFATTYHHEDGPPQFAFTSLTPNEFSGFGHRTIRQEEEVSQSSFTSNESRGTLASTSITDIAVETGRLTHYHSSPQLSQGSDETDNHSSPQLSQGSDETDNTTLTDHVLDGTPEVEEPNIEEILPAEVPMVAPMSDHERRIFFKSAFKDALVQAYQETDDSKGKSTLSMKETLTSVFYQQDIAGIAIHAAILT